MSHRGEFCLLLRREIFLQELLLLHSHLGKSLPEFIFAVPTCLLLTPLPGPPLPPVVPPATHHAADGPEQTACHGATSTSSHQLASMTCPNLLNKMMESWNVQISRNDNNISDLTLSLIRLTIRGTVTPPLLVWTGENILFTILQIVRMLEWGTVWTAVRTGLTEWRVCGENMMRANDKNKYVTFGQKIMKTRLSHSHSLCVYGFMTNTKQN